MGLSTTTESASALKSTSESATPGQAVSRHLLTAVLPDDPVVTIEPKKGWSPIELRDLWAFREQLYFLTWRDVKVRYKQTALGVAWAILQPLLTMLIFTIFFGKLAGIESQTAGIPYPIFAYAALLPWTFFANGINNSGNSL